MDDHGRAFKDSQAYAGTESFTHIANAEAQMRSKSGALLPQMLPWEKTAT